MKKSNLYLIVAIVLLLSAVLLIMFSDDGETRTFRKNLVSIDTSNITALLLYPQKEQGQEIKFEKTGNEWDMTSSDGNTSPIDAMAIQQMIGTLLTIKPERVAGRGKEKWENFEVDNAKGTRVKVIEGSEETLDIYIGKFSVNQSQQQTPPQGGTPGQLNQQPQITSYVRLAEDDAVYAVNGLLNMNFNRSASDFVSEMPPPVNSNMISDSLQIKTNE